MDEDQYRSTYHQLNHQRCVFEKMVLLRYGSCQYSQKLLLAEREAISCQSADNAHKQCQLLLNSMRHNARFSLQITQANEPLAHAKELKVQAGGLYGLQQYMAYKDTADTNELSDDKLKFDHNNSQPIRDIYNTITAALAKFNQIKYLPYNEIIKSIKHFEIPSRKRRK